MGTPPPRARALLFLGLLPIFIALVIYSQTWAFIADEGFHLIAARLIAGGKRPYIDFCFPQTPLNAYINSLILLKFGDNWRPIHLAASLYMSAAVWLVADFVQTRLPFERWRTPCALAAGVMFGLNTVVVQFGPAAQAYAIAMLFGTAAYRLALPSIYSRQGWYAFLAGLFAAGAAASTLLTAPVPAVLLLWLLFFHAAGSRALKIAAYLAGCLVPFAPVFWLYLQGPQQTLFNVFQYQTLYRRTNWGDANLHDLDALTDWVNSGQALMLIVLFTAALIFLYRNRHSDWMKVWREFFLAMAMSVALVAFISTAHPTFERYYSVSVPFLAIVAALGIYAVGSRLASPQRAWLSAALVVALAWSIFARAMFDEREDQHWADYEEVSHEVAEVAPIGSSLLADEMVFFLLQRDPPPGLEFSYAEKLELPRNQEELFHIVSAKELRDKIQAGQFAVVQTCRESVLEDLEPANYFRHHTQPSDCDVFWQPTATKLSGKR